MQRSQILTIEELNNLYPEHVARRPTFFDRLKEQCFCSKRRVCNVLTSFLPILKVVATYKKEYFAGDLIAGLTVSFMHLPQGLAFSVLAGLPAVYGLYTTFFPLLFYMLFGTSPYVAFATNAVIALLVQKIVLSESAIFESTLFEINQSSSTANFSSSNVSTFDEDLIGNMLLDNKISTAVTASFLIGVMLAALGLFRMGFLLSYMSESFIGGFTTAAGIHIVSSQVPKMFGVKVSAHSGAGNLVKMYIQLFENIDQTIAADIVITIVCIILLLTVKVCINERFKSRLKIPIPIDLIVVVVATVISNLANFKEELSVSVIGNIPSGFHRPTVPALEVAPRIIVDCFIMAILTLMMTISLAKLTAKIHEQRIDDNQEMVAYGLTNILSSFFACFPQSATPSRTMLDSDLGANTTLNSLPTVVFMLLVILWIGPLFYSLPMSVLAAMIAVAMKNLLLQFRNLPKIWKINKFDFFVWIISCFVSVFANLDYGIIAGIGFSILSVVIQHQTTGGVLLGVAENKNIFLDSEHRENVKESCDVKMFQFQSPLYFINVELFKSELYNKITDPMKLTRKRNNKSLTMIFSKGEEVGNDSTPYLTENSDQSSTFVTNVVQYIILDCQMISYIDTSGISILCQVIKEYKSADIHILLAKCPQRLLNTLAAADFFDNYPLSHVFYDISDAINFIENKKAI